MSGKAWDKQYFFKESSLYKAVNDIKNFLIASIKTVVMFSCISLNYYQEKITLCGFF